MICPTDTARPLYWQKPVYELDPDDPTNNGFINEDLIIWMREAAFPNFKKLYGVLNRADEVFAKGLPAGNYTIDINYSILSLLGASASSHCLSLNTNTWTTRRLF